MALDLVNEEGFETVRYDIAGIPIYIRDDYLSYFPNYHCASHWHEDLECINVLEGTMTVCVNGESLMLSSGDTLVINCERIHSCRSIAKQECPFHGFILHPDLITVNQELIKKYIEPITKLSTANYLLVDEEHEITAILLKKIYLKATTTYMFQVQTLQFKGRCLYLFTATIHLIFHSMKLLRQEMFPRANAVSFLKSILDNLLLILQMIIA